MIVKREIKEKTSYKKLSFSEGEALPDNSPERISLFQL